ncbi:vWA domain-containing protein [Limnoglobus roseus]|nr:BatA and WFA domain-containing protein [Limnoglobus roseus]
MRTIFPLLVVLLLLVALPGVVVFAADLMGYEASVNEWLEGRLGVSHRVAIALPAAMVLFCVPPLIVLLYFLRLRRKPVAVSSTYLWKKSIEDLHVNRLMQWLRQNVLLLLQLLAALLCIYAVLGPRLHGSIFGGRHYILMIDNSASMSATDVAPTRLAWAKQQALREIDAATDDDTGMLIVFNSTAETAQSYTNNRGELRTAVERIEPTQKPTRIEEALSLAASLANPVKSTENEATIPGAVVPGKERQYVPTEGVPADVHVFSDGRFPFPAEFALANLNLTYHVPPAEGSNNLALSRLTVDRGWQKPLPDDDENDPADPTPKVADRDADDATKATVTAFVKNYRSKPADKIVVRLEVLDAGRNLLRAYSRTLRPAAKRDQNVAGKAVQFYLPELAEGADLTLHARLEGANDSLPLDDESWFVLGVVRKAKVLIVTPDDNKLLRAFFESDAHKALADRTWETPAALTDAEKYLKPAREGKFDLVIFDRCGPATEDAMPNANTWFIGHPPPPFKPATAADDPQRVVPVKGPSVQGSLDRHPIMRNLRGLYDMAIDESFQLPSLPNGTQRLLEAAGGQVLIAGLPRGPFTDLVMAFPLMTSANDWNTLWPLQPSFVLFVRNVVTTLGNVRDAATEDPITTGQEKPIATGVTRRITVTSPDGKSKVFDRGTPRPEFIYTNTDQIGPYAATWAEPGTDRTAGRRFAVNLVPTAEHDESDIAVTTEIRIGVETIAADEPRKQPRDLWKIAVLLGLLVLMAEWWVYNRRVQI